MGLVTVRHLADYDRDAQSFQLLFCLTYLSSKLRGRKYIIKEGFRAELEGTDDIGSQWVGVKDGKECIATSLVDVRPVETELWEIDE